MDARNVFIASPRYISMSNVPSSDVQPAQNPYSIGQQTAAPPVIANHSGEDATGGLIPYNNPPALIAYYLGLFSLFPLLGLFLAVPAFILGMMGLRRRRQNPAVRGSVHAWIGMIMGGMMTVVWGVVICLIVVAVLVEASSNP